MEKELIGLLIGLVNAHCKVLNGEIWSVQSRQINGRLIGWSRPGICVW